MFQIVLSLIHVSELVHRPVKQKRAYRSRKSLTPEEKLVLVRKARNEGQRRWRERRKREIGVKAYNEMESARRRKSYVKAADLPLDKLLEWRRKERERKYKLRQKLKLQKQKREDKK